MIDIVEEPSGVVYSALIRFAVAQCDRFYLVWREQWDFNRSAYQLKADLRRWEIERERTDAWDGTRLLGHYADIHHYRLDRHSADLLCAATPGLYGWLSPDLPEDLTFRRREGNCWLATISHERMAWFPPTGLAKEVVRRNVPGISIR